MTVRHRVVAGQVHTIPAGVCTYCHTRPPSNRAPALHCQECDRHIGGQRMHVVVPWPDPDRVLCLRCVDRADLYGTGAMASRAAAAKLLGVWP